MGNTKFTEYGLILSNPSQYLHHNATSASRLDKMTKDRDYVVTHKHGRMHQLAYIFLYLVCTNNVLICGFERDNTYME